MKPETPPDRNCVDRSEQLNQLMNTLHDLFNFTAQYEFDQQEIRAKEHLRDQDIQVVVQGEIER